MTKRALPLLLATLAGCSLAPAYHRPAAPIAATWPTAARESAGTQPAADIGWQSFFGDPRLRELVSLALKNNRDLRIAALHAEAARAAYGIQDAGLFPTVDATAADSAQRVAAGMASPGSPAVTSHKYSVGLGFTAFEIDLFGHLRNLKDAALEQYLASEEARTSAQISLVAAVADSYLGLRALDASLTVAQDTETSLRASLDLTRKSYALGNVSALDVQSAQAQLAAAVADGAALEQQRDQAAHALTVLVGGPLPAGLPAPRPLTEQGILADLPPGLPSDLLERRPDVRAAEDQLKAANADIGAARAAFFPELSLTGGLGFASPALSSLFGSGASTWNFTPQLTLPIFDAGRNRANLDLAHVEDNIQVAQYEKTVQNAFREVADALSAQKLLDVQVKAREQLVAASQQRYTLAEARYRNGIDSYLSLLDAQRSLYAAQQALIQAQLTRLQNQVAFYKALGGGWRRISRTPSA